MDDHELQSYMDFFVRFRCTSCGKLKETEWYLDNMIEEVFKMQMPRINIKTFHQAMLDRLNSYLFHEGWGVQLASKTDGPYPVCPDCIFENELGA